MHRFISVFLFLIGILPALSAQNKIVFYPIDSIPKDIAYEKQVKDNSAARLQGNKIVTQLMNRGYLTASLDTILYKNDTAFVSIFKGNTFQWGVLNYRYLPRNMLKQFGFNQTANGFIKTDELKKAMTQTIRYFENQGYPFAYFYWDSLQIHNDTVSGSLYFEKNILITFDTLALYGDAGVSKKFLYNYLGFKPGEPYQEDIYLAINNKLAKLPFTSVLSKPQVFFIGRQAIVLLNLKKRRTDRLDGLIGFAPNTGIPGSTKLLVTGEFHLDFKNLKESGNALKADWTSFRARSQALNIGVGFPYILNQPIGADFAADFLKYDTIYTETRFGFGVQYLFSGLDNIKFFYEQKSTNLQTVDTIAIRQREELGEFTAMKTQRYGIAFNSVTFDNRMSPKKGYLADVNISLFKRNIVKDDRIAQVNFTNPITESTYTVYDSIRLTSYQFMFQYHLIKAISVAKHIVLFNELKGYNLISPNIYFNELYRFGGNNTFKGFNEQSLFASSLTIFNLEVRYLLSEYSFFKMFGNAAYYMDKSKRPGKIAEDFPYGFGAGFNVETGAGIFSISVALGHSKYIPIDFKNAKVHFGLINYF